MGSLQGMFLVKTNKVIRTAHVTVKRLKCRYKETIELLEMLVKGDIYIY